MITHVAIRHNGEIISLPKPNRHHDIIRTLKEPFRGDPQWDQGFLNDKGQYLHRKAALLEAIRCEQLLPRATCSGKMLFSEDVW